MLTFNKKDLILIFFLMLIGFFMLFNSHKRPHWIFYDEKIYFSLATSTQDNVGAYNTQKLYQESIKKHPNYPYPAFINAPIFKHPPMFTDMLRFSFFFPGNAWDNAFYINYLIFLCIIPLIYLLTCLCFDRTTALIATALISFEPILNITAQKLLADNALMLFSTLSFLLYARITKKYSCLLCICAGIAAGFAFLIKYPGILITLSIFLYSICLNHTLLRRKSFILSLLIPFFMMIPWIILNYHTYGLSFLLENHQFVDIWQRFNVLIFTPSSYLFLALTTLSICLLKQLKNLRQSCIILLFFILLTLLAPYIIKTLTLLSLPKGECSMIAFFAKMPFYFYLCQLLEFFPFYCFALLSILVYFFDTDYKDTYLLISVPLVTMLCFFMYWGSYQSRYVIPCIPFLVILASRTIVFFASTLLKMNNLRAQSILIKCFLFIIFWMTIKLGIVNHYFLNHTNLCYY